MKTFCSAVYSALSIRNGSGGVYTPCCDIDRRYANRQRHTSVEDYFNNNMLRKDVIQYMDSGQWHPACNACERLEESGLRSSRHNYNEKYGIDNRENKIRYLEFRPSNLCNLKCRMCHPYDSSQIYRELDNNPSLAKFWLMAEMPVDTTINIDDFPDLDHIKVLGGEPSIDERVVTWLWDIVNKGRATNIKLSVTSNFTNLNKSWCDVLNQFDRINFSASIDGAGATYEYIRTPARWTVVRDNFMRVREVIPKTHRLSINFVNSLYNCFTIKDWYPKMLALLEHANHDVDILTSRGSYCPSACDLPWTYKQSIIEEISTLENEYGTSEFLTKYRKRITTDGIVKDISQFFSYSEQLDSIRGTDLYSLSPQYRKLKDEQNIL